LSEGQDFSKLRGLQFEKSARFFVVQNGRAGACRVHAPEFFRFELRVGSLQFRVNDTPVFRCFRLLLCLKVGINVGNSQYHPLPQVVLTSSKLNYRL